ncbi:hypothetical protein SQ11_08490 [Nitrosospira sp. NpAV]|nr:hypothetical protein SQ11_08490 [Nitrosospira sp. NpAV]
MILIHTNPDLDPDYSKISLNIASRNYRVLPPFESLFFRYCFVMVLLYFLSAVAPSYFTERSGYAI